MSRGRCLKFKHDGNRYLLAWYERRREPCPDCNGRGFPRDGGSGLCRGCHGRRYVWPLRRTVGRSSDLLTALAQARGEQGPSLDSALIVHYVYSTGWGAALPGAERLRDLLPPGTVVRPDNGPPIGSPDHVD